MPREKTQGFKGNTAAKRQDEVELRQNKAFELRKEGATFQQIGKVLNISHEQARKDYNVVMDQIRSDFEGEIAQWRALQLARLNDQYMVFNAIAKGKLDPEMSKRSAPDIEAGRLALNVLKEISDITGVKASIKHEFTGKDGGPIQVTSAVDLSNLSTEELLQYEGLLRKASGNAE
jgi:hypothetical protein